MAKKTGFSWSKKQNLIASRTSHDCHIFQNIWVQIFWIFRWRKEILTKISTTYSFYGENSRVNYDILSHQPTSNQQDCHYHGSFQRTKWGSSEKYNTHFSWIPELRARPAPYHCRSHTPSPPCRTKTMHCCLFFVAWSSLGDLEPHSGHFQEAGLPHASDIISPQGTLF
jgi:hypothetical protein